MDTDDDLTFDRWLAAHLRPEMFPREVQEAVDALLAGEGHPLLDRLRDDATESPDPRYGP